MGRYVIYCVICGGPLETIYNNAGIQDGYEERILPIKVTEVGNQPS